MLWIHWLVFKCLKIVKNCLCSLPEVTSSQCLFCVTRRTKPWCSSWEQNFCHKLIRLFKHCHGNRIRMLSGLTLVPNKPHPQCCFVCHQAPNLMGKWRLSQSGTTSACFHVSIILNEWLNSMFCPVLLVFVTLRKKGKRSSCRCDSRNYGITT